MSELAEFPRGDTRDLEIAKAEAELARLRNACSRENDAICQTLGAALGYPRYCDDQKNFPGATPADGVCVGEHVAATLAAEAAERIGKLTAERDSARTAMAQACKVIGDRGICERDASVPSADRVNQTIVDLQTGLDDAENHVGQLRWFAVQIMAERDAARSEVERLNAEMALIVRIMNGPPEAVAAEVEAMEPGRTRAAWLAVEIANKQANAIAKARENVRLRKWLQWVLVADADELERWRHGDHAAAMVNGEAD